MGWSHFLIADVFDHARVLGTSYSFLYMRLAVLFMLVAM